MFQISPAQSVRKGKIPNSMNFAVKVYKKKPSTNKISTSSFVCIERKVLGFCLNLILAN